MPYKVLGMLRDGGLGKDMNSGVHVPYMSEMERETYKVTVHDGVVWWQFAPLDMGNQSFLYVMDAGGNIFTGPQSEVEHHSSFLSGQPVAAAGMWRVTKGNVVFINGDSGHYQPPGDFSAQFMAELGKRGVSLTAAETDFYMTSEQMKLRMKHRAGIEGLKWWQIERGGKVVQDEATGVTKADGEAVKTGATHIQGQRLRLYPGKKPDWTWY